MQPPGLAGQYSWNLADGEADESLSVFLPRVPTQGDPASEPTQPLSDVTAPLAAADEEGDGLLSLFATARTSGAAQSANTGFQAEPLPIDATSGHAGGCACGACAMPGYDDSELGGITGSNTRGPEGVVIDGSVALSTVPAGGVGVALGNTFKLHSLPSSKFTIYLDFDGHTTTGTTWNSYWQNSSFYSSAFSTDSSESFNTTELLRIQQIWARVAEYFSPFNVNVTTQDPGVAALSYTGTTDAAYGIRVVITDEGGKNFGGIAYKNSFMWSQDTPVYVYSNRLADNAKSIADAVAHEVGHSMGLDHDGKGTAEYYYGHGSGTTDWAPILGVGYNANIVQWSKGEYTGSTNKQDDLAIITSKNGGVTYRADDYGNTFGTAAQLGGTVAGGVATVSTYGVISGSGANNDIDMFKFELGANGAIDFKVSAFTRAYVTGSTTPIYTASPFSMLDVALVLYNETFQVVASWNDTTKIDGEIKLSGLDSGTYFLSLDGVGWGDPLAATPTGYTEYGSLGQYMITGTYTVAGSTGGGTGGGGTGGGSTGGGSTGGGGTGGTKTLTLDRSSLTTSEGGTETFTIRANGATGDVAVSITGLNEAQGSLTASQVMLNAANNWTAAVNVTGVNNRNAEGDVSYSLQFNADGYTTQTVAVTSQDDDIAAKGAGTVFGTYTTKPNVNNANLAAQSTVDSKFSTWSEGILSNGKAGIELRWEFAGLTAGDKLVQVDAWSAKEAFRFEYSVDGAATWRTFAGATDGSLKWNSDLLATGVGTSMWVRLVDTVRTDTTRETISVGLLTITDATGSTGGGGASDFEDDSSGDQDSGGGDQDSGGGGGGGSGDGGGAAKALVLSRTDLTTPEGGTQSFSITATGTTGDVTVTIGGLDAAEGTLSASQLLLTAANNWTASVAVTGKEDRNVDADASYTLTVAAAGFDAKSIIVINANDDFAAKAAGTVFGDYSKKPNVNNANVAAQTTDDGKFSTWSEGTFSDGKVGIDLRWEFDGLAAGNKLVQVDAWSGKEAFRFEYSVDGASTWRSFAGATEGSLKWDTDLLATDVDSNLWVRLVDTVRTDTTAETISVGLLTVAPASDHLFA